MIALMSEIAISTITRLNGNAPITMAVWIAAISPTISSAATTSPRAEPQKMIWGRALGPSSPAALIVLTISTAESADVTR